MKGVSSKIIMTVILLIFLVFAIIVFYWAIKSGYEIAIGGIFE